jgi:hypothetical protein
VEILEEFDRSVSGSTLHGASASTDVSNILAKHQNLKSLYLQLPGSKNSDGIHWNHDHECDHALENIKLQKQSFLKHLTLDGEFLMTDKAWKHWETSIPWSQLESLCIRRASLIDGLANRLDKMALPSLREMRLSNPYSVRYDVLIAPVTLKLLPDYVTNQDLAYLSLNGYSYSAVVQYIHASARSANNLQKLCFHNSNVKDFASPWDLEELKACPVLTQLSFDLHKGYSLRWVENGGFAGYLDAVAELRPLQHIGFIIRHSRKVVGDDTGKDEVLRAFRYLQNRKKGNRLVSMDMSRNWSGWEPESWTVWAWGKDRVLLESEGSERPRRLEMWDIDKMVKLEDVVGNYRSRGYMHVTCTSGCWVKNRTYWHLDHLIDEPDSPIFSPSSPTGYS